MLRVLEATRDVAGFTDSWIWHSHQNYFGEGFEERGGETCTRKFIRRAKTTRPAGIGAAEGAMETEPTALGRFGRVHCPGFTAPSMDCMEVIDPFHTMEHFGNVPVQCRKHA